MAFLCWRLGLGFCIESLESIGRYSVYSNEKRRSLSTTAFLLYDNSNY